MPKLNSLVKGIEIPSADADFKASVKVEQYRIGREALYMPEGFRWNYIPFTAIRQVNESFRVISAGHCVPVREKRPELDLETDVGTIHLQLEKQESMEKVRAALCRPGKDPER